MKKTLLFSLLICYGTLTKAQLLYNMADSAEFLYAASSWGQTSNTTNNQVILFDDVNIPKAGFVGYDSIAITKMTFRIIRYANAPATTLNIWYAPIVDTATMYETLIKVPPRLVASVNLPAQGSASEPITVSVGDSVNTIFKAAVDTGVYFENYTSFAIGLSYSDTTGNGWYLGGSTGNTTRNDNVIFLYDPTESTNTVQPTNFGIYPKAQMNMRLYGYAAGVLPITYTYFKGEHKAGKNLLSWSTASEHNNIGFDLQRSVDGKGFSTIYTLSSKASEGNSNTEINYAYTDESFVKGTNYYRLAQKDKDGKISYSQIIAIQTANTARFEIVAAYPNPVINQLQIKYSAVQHGKAILSVSDMSGNVVIEQTQNIQAGENLLKLNLSLLSKGNYFIKMINPDGTFSTQKILKQ